MEVSPAAAPTAEAPGPDPVTADRFANLERKYSRLRREMDRMARIMALLEHDLAIERIVAAQPSLLDKLGAWAARLATQWAGWISPWTFGRDSSFGRDGATRGRPRMQRPLA